MSLPSLPTGPAATFPAAGSRDPGPDPWASVEQARAWWPDAAGLDEEYLTTLLGAATHQCAGYAPAGTTTALSDSDRLAVVFQARDLHNARTAGYAPPDGLYPSAEPRPMSLQVRQLLRPPTGPGIG